VTERDWVTQCFEADRTRLRAVAVQMGGAVKEARGAAAVAGAFSGRAQAVRPAFVNGAAGAVWTHRGQPRVVFRFTVTDGKITEIELIGDPVRLGQLELAM
jgi:hypothetical protein